MFKKTIVALISLMLFLVFVNGHCGLALSQPYLAFDYTYRVYDMYEVAVGKVFDEIIIVKQLDAGWDLADVATHLAYNPVLLSVENVSFDSLWNTASWDEPASGDLLIQASNATESPLSGDVLIATVTFKIIFQDGVPPRVYGSYDASVLDLHDYTLSDSAGSPIPTDMEIDGYVWVYCLMGGSPMHDIIMHGGAVLKTVVGQNYTASLYATVSSFHAGPETFNVTFYANETTIGILTNVTIWDHYGNETSDLMFSWNTTGFTKGNYTIAAYASPVAGETNITNNNLTVGWIVVAMVGDITGPDGLPDNKCDMRDIGLIARYFGETVPPADSNLDMNEDQTIDMRDIGVVARHFGEADS